MATALCLWRWRPAHRPLPTLGATKPKLPKLPHAEISPSNRNPAACCSGIVWYPFGALQHSHPIPGRQSFPSIPFALTAKGGRRNTAVTMRLILVLVRGGLCCHMATVVTLPLHALPGAWSSMVMTLETLCQHVQDLNAGISVKPHQAVARGRSSSGIFPMRPCASHVGSRRVSGATRRRPPGIEASSLEAGIVHEATTKSSSRCSSDGQWI